ncbi:MAG: ABC transporter substrate-binding protein [Flavobacteriales bacterium]|nr:ABC transporter substrate-binding protein [Flavobacteriales bacterium]
MIPVMLRGVLFIFVSAFLWSCGSHQQDSLNVFRYNESAGISSLDPAFTRNLENIWAVNQLFDGLVELDSNMSVVPLIAQSWDILNDGTEYIFHLRPNVYFHSDPCFGADSTRAVTAHDFVYSFGRIVDPVVASPGKWVFNLVDTSRYGGFHASNDSTFHVYLREAFPPFLGMLSMQYCDVVPKEAIDTYGRDFRSHPVGTGPFRFAFWIENVALIYHRNAHFWQRDGQGSALPYLDAVRIDFVKDMTGEYLGLLKGDYDFMSGIHPAFKDELLTPDGTLSPSFQEHIRFQRTPFLKTDYIGILVDDTLPLSTESPLYNVLVRRALNYGFDRKEMVRYLRNNSVFPAEGGFIPRGLPGYNEHGNYGYTYDPEKAAALLKEAGFPGGQGLPPLVLTTTADYVDLCEYMQHAYGKLGLQVNIDVLPSSTHREYVSKSKVNLFRKSWLADYADAENFLGLFFSPNFCPDGPNYTHFHSASFDSLFVRARKENDWRTRVALYQQLDSLVMEQAPVIPLFYDQVSHFVRKEVSGLSTNPINLLDLKTVRKSRKE